MPSGHAGVLTRFFQKFHNRCKFLALKFEYIEMGALSLVNINSV